MWNSTDSSFWKEQASVSRGWNCVHAVGEHLLRGRALEIGDGGAQTAHSPSPRWTWNGPSRLKSMN